MPWSLSCEMSSSIFAVLTSSVEMRLWRESSLSCASCLSSTFPCLRILSAVSRRLSWNEAVSWMVCSKDVIAGLKKDPRIRCSRGCPRLVRSVFPEKSLLELGFVCKYVI